MNQGDLIPIVLLSLLSLALGSGAFMIFLVMRWARHHRQMFESGLEVRQFYEASARRVHTRKRPLCWLAVRSRNLPALLQSLGLKNPRPCPWSEGITGRRALYVSPPVNGWIIVVGGGLPDPSHDVDACFRLMLELSRQFGQVQFFKADPVLHHHAWASAEAGRIRRGYAWAGTTVWNQGVKSDSESALGLKCFAYGEECGPERLGITDVVAANEEKVPQLAARWSLDPAEIHEHTFSGAPGVAGNPTLRF
jgi:hypothetical protein